MAFKIKDNLDLYGNQLLNFALQSDSGFPQSPQVGHMFNYTGTGVMANHAVMCVDETTKAFKALAFVDEIATNTAFTALTDRVETIEKALGEDTANVIDTWEEIQNFLKDINANDANLMTMLNGKLDKSGGTISGSSSSVTTPLTINTTYYYEVVAIGFNHKGVNRGGVGLYANGAWLVYGDGPRIGIRKDGTPAYSLGYNQDGYDLLHSGNIGEYAPLRRTRHNTIDLNTAANGFYEVGYSSQTATNTPSDYDSAGSLLMDFRDANGYAKIQFLGKNDSEGLWFRAQQGAGSNITSAWKRIAFTDSNVASAQALKHSNGTTAIVSSSDGSTAFNGQLNISTQAICGLSAKSILVQSGDGRLFVGLGSSGLGYNTIVCGNEVQFRYSTSGNTGFILNSSGNVTIGGSDSGITNAKLYVNGRVYSKTAFLFDGDYGIWKGTQYTGSMALTDIVYNGTKHSFLNGNVGIGTIDPLAKFEVNSQDTPLSSDTTKAGFAVGYHNDDAIYMGIDSSSLGKPFGWIQCGYGSQQGTTGGKNLTIQPLGGNVLIGTPNEIKSGAKLQIKGDVYVDGNIIATKESSAGGAGEEGESGAGGAEVIDKELAKGQSSYTIPNTIGRSAVAVSLYEWNANNSSWDMCLADISVKDATITVTFGSATSVNHKLVAVG